MFFLIAVQQIKEKSNQPSISENNQRNITETKKSMEEMVREQGAEETYEAVKEEASKKDIQSAHTHVHLLGEVFYNELGMDGVRFCDSSYDYACYHGIFLQAIATEGTDILENAKEDCRLSPSLIRCYHGIGHGLMEYYGPKKINQALLACPDVPGAKLFGCQEGVFMQFAFADRFSEGRNTKQEDPRIQPGMNTQDLYSTCEEAPEEDRLSCYYFMPQWWAATTKEDYKRLGEICEGISDEMYKTACFLKTGTEISDRGKLNVDRSVSNCRLMPSLKAEALCRGGIAWSLYVNPSKTDPMFMCEDLTSENKKICIDGFDFVKSNGSLQDNL
jgi:hypothetical protein